MFWELVPAREDVWCLCLKRTDRTTILVAHALALRSDRGISQLWMCVNDFGVPQA